MAYVKWVANSNPYDWTTELELEDGTTVRQGEPVELTKELKEALEGDGRVFEDSSAAEAKEFEERAANTPVVGTDVAGAGPVFENAGPGNQSTDAEASESKKSNEKK
jgi:hypothetical protein